MEPRARVRVVAGKHAGTVGEFVGEGPRGVSVKPDGSSIILSIPTNGREPVIEPLDEKTPNPNP